MAKPKTYDFLYKLLFVGDAGVGKTALITRFADDTFTDTSYTMGIDFKIKTIELDGKKIKLQVWDTYGGERFRTVTRSYFRGTAGIMLVYDITKEKTLDNVANNWLTNANEYAHEDVVKTLLGNKCDLEEERKISRGRGEEFAEENGMKFFETSAKENINVEEAFMTMAADILTKFPEGHPSLQGVVKPGSKKGDSSRSQRCF